MELEQTAIEQERQTQELERLKGVDLELERRTRELQKRTQELERLKRVDVGARAEDPGARAAEAPGPRARAAEAKAVTGGSIRSPWHEAPDLLEFEASVLDAEPGRVRLSHSSFYPGGGGQPADRGILRWAGGEVRVERIEADGDARLARCWRSPS